MTHSRATHGGWALALVVLAVSEALNAAPGRAEARALHDLQIMPMMDSGMPMRQH
jgi:hypothetical protein